MMAEIAVDNDLMRSRDAMTWAHPGLTCDTARARPAKPQARQHFLRSALLLLGTGAGSDTLINQLTLEVSANAGVAVRPSPLIVATPHRYVRVFS